LRELRAVPAFITAAIIFATYLRFRRAAASQKKINAIPAEARSVLQPYLAVVGLALSVLFGFFFKRSS